MNYEEALFQIEWYARRCNIAHSGIDEDINAERWHEVAMYICRDRAAIQKRMISEGDSNLESGLLTEISIFENPLFREHLVRYEKVYGASILPLQTVQTYQRTKAGEEGYRS
jgi:hypothetical protein